MSMVEGRDESENHEIDQNYRTTFVCCSSLEWFNYWRFSSNAWPPSLNLKAHFYLILHFLKLLICCIVNEIVLRKCLQCVLHRYLATQRKGNLKLVIIWDEQETLVKKDARCEGREMNLTELVQRTKSYVHSFVLTLLIYLLWRWENFPENFCRQAMTFPLLWYPRRFFGFPPFPPVFNLCVCIYSLTILCLTQIFQPTHLKTFLFMAPKTLIVKLEKTWRDSQEEIAASRSAEDERSSP